ncbi:MAG: hypothetical protein HY800_06175, partial [Ignavibacteriales bacterium]|nr:hypothetical protein [Ignavibacteriales bacterium]
MARNLMSFKYLLVSEKATLKQSSHHVGGWISTYPTFIDCLFETSYFTGISDAPDTPNGSFHAFAHHDYLRIPYTIRAISLLIESGYYLEATVLLRNLYEVFVQLRYFHAHKKLL